MKWQNCYFEYDSTISPELYQMIIAVLRAEGYKFDGGDRTYDAFKSRYKYFNINYSTFIIQGHSNNGTKIDVLQILPNLTVRKNILEPYDGFIVGKTYASLGNGDDKPIVFLRQPDGTHRPFVSYRTGMYSETNVCCVNDDILIRPATDDEANHLRKSIENKVFHKTLDVNINDYVVCVNGSDTRIPVGYVYRVEGDVNSNNFVRGLNGDLHGYGAMNNEYFRKATEHEKKIYDIFKEPMPINILDAWKSFEVGDCVVRIDETSSATSMPSKYVYKTVAFPHEPTFILDKFGTKNGFHDGRGGNYKKFRPATVKETELYKAHDKPVSIDLIDPVFLLEEAKRRYPVGTKYYPAHLTSQRTQHCTVSNPANFTVMHGRHGLYISESSGNLSKNGHTLSEIIFDEFTWAVKVEENTISETSSQSSVVMNESSLSMFPELVVEDKYVDITPPSLRIGGKEYPSEPVKIRESDLEKYLSGPTLEEVRKKYPIGTRFKSVALHIGEIFTVKKPVMFEYNGFTHSEIGYVYYNGEWAEIISSSETTNPCDEVVLRDPSLDLSIKKVKKIEVEVPRKKEIVLDLTIKNSKR